MRDENSSEYIIFKNNYVQPNRAIIIISFINQFDQSKPVWNHMSTLSSLIDQIKLLVIVLNHIMSFFIYTFVLFGVNLEENSYTPLSSNHNEENILYIELS